MDIAKLDRNFAVDTKIDLPGLKYFDPQLKPFKIYGVSYENGHYCRMPEEIGKRVSDGVCGLAKCTAGGRIRFKTNSPYVAVYVKYASVGKMPHFAFTGSIGLDLYADDGDGYGDYYVGTYTPPVNITDSYEGAVKFLTHKMRTVTVNMPLYSRVNEIYIGVDENSEIREAENYKTELPVVYYGSSITMGGCASRAGNLYSNIVSRKLSCDHINLGFSGNARGETAVAEYIASLNMSAFVYDYDHNAPDAEHLRKTHEPFYKIVRDKHPDIPIIFMSRTFNRLHPESVIERRGIIETTYKNALSRGENVYFITGETIFSELTRESATVDGIHPNDSGFVEMAERVCEVLKKAL